MKFFKSTNTLMNIGFLLLFMGCFYLFAGEIYSFFFTLNSTLSDSSWGDVSWVHQQFYNFTTGRPLQTSIYYFSGEGVTGNTAGYANQIAMHINISPFILSFFYKLWPNLNMLYAIVILFNVIGFAVFSFLILKTFKKENLLSRFLIALTILLAGPLAPIITYKALFPLYQGVFLLALFYFSLAKKRIPFIVTTILFLLVSDDSALLGLTFAAVLFIYHFKDKFYSLFLGLSSVFYVVVAAVIVSPVAKFELLTIQNVSSDTIVRLQNLFNGMYTFNYRDIYIYRDFILAVLLISVLLVGKVRRQYLFGAACFSMAAYFIVAAPFVPYVNGGGLHLILAVLLIGVLLVGKIRWQNLFWAACFIVAAPFSHWFVTFVNGGGHHLIPVYACIVIAVLILLSEFDLNTVRWRFIPAVFLVGLIYYQRRQVEYPLLSVPNAQYFHQQKSSNEAVIERVQNIPQESSLVYWTNRGIEGFIVNRHDIWRFPSYYGEADYLIIQKDAQETFFTTRTNQFERKNCEKSNLNITRSQNNILNEALGCGFNFSTGRYANIPADVIELIKTELVDKQQTHVVESDNARFILLKRKVSSAIPQPESSIGMGWVNNIGPYFKKKYQ